MKSFMRVDKLLLIDHQAPEEHTNDDSYEDEIGTKPPVARLLIDFG